MFNSKTDMNSPEFKLGMVFGDARELRKALDSYVVWNRVKVRKIRNSSTRLDVVFIDGCPWYMNASKDARTSSFFIMKFCGIHTCSEVGNVKSLTAPFL